MTAPHASINLLAQMLTGIQHPDFLPLGHPTFSADEIKQLPGKDDSVSMLLVSPSGDRFLVTVEWLREESP